MLSSLLTLVLLPSLSFAYSFTFSSVPKQCADLSLSISGSGSPPYSLLIIPFGPTPLPNNIEARKITQQNFTGTSSSLTFQLKFPANSQFVAVVSDSSGFGSGGTSGAVTVLASDSNDASCFDATHNVSPSFAFSIVPGGLITQCNNTRIWWDPAQVQGTPSFQGVIPGGQSFAIPEGSLTTVPNEGLGFDWTPSVRQGTTLLLLGGDDRGPGSAGSVVYIVGNGPNDCLNDSSPSSTPGSPAGGSYPTSTSGAGIGSGGSHTNVGAIVGGVIGGVVGLIALVLVLLFCRRRQKFHKSQKERPVDLLREDEETNEGDGRLPRYYEPEPFIVPDPTVTSGDDRGSLRPSTDRRQSALTYETASAPGNRVSTPDPSNMGTSTYMRKSPAPPTFRPVNIVQHEDAGPSDAPPQEEQEETIELPPAYTNIKKAMAAETAEPSSTTHPTTAAPTTATAPTATTAPDTAPE